MLALSGGGDSMALLAIAADWARHNGRRLIAVTVDHGLNPESPAWSRRCAEACAALGVEWIEWRWIGAKPSRGVTAAARASRHALIAEAARQAGACVVLMAHTADDVAEADWMRERGSTLGRLRDWSPSPVWPEGRGLMLFRPLLEERREALRSLLLDRGLSWIEDPANADDQFGRARARKALIPVPEGKGEGLRRPSGETGTPHPSGFAHRSALRASVPLPLGEGFTIGRLISPMELATALLCASGQTVPPRGARLATLIVRLQSSGDFTATLAGARIVALGGSVLIGREPGELKRHPATELHLEPGVPAVWDGRFEITAREDGWTAVAALGRLNHLSTEDRAILASVPAWARGGLPVLIRDGGADTVLAWRAAEVRALAPRRLELTLSGSISGETTQEADLFRAVHGETPPSDLFSRQHSKAGASMTARPKDREPI